MKKKLRIIKPKTRPIQIEPWFFRYLNEGQLKVVSAILGHADIKDRQNNSFPSNRTIAFYCGFGDIIPGSKTETKYKALNKEEQLTYKLKRKKNAIQTVKNIKKDLINIGLLQTQKAGKIGREVVYYTLDLEWKKKQYIKEFDEHFNDEEIEEDNEQTEDILKEFEEIKRLFEQKEISPKNLSNRLKGVAYKIEADSHDENSFIPVEDIDKVANYHMNTTKIRTKVELGEITNEKAYRQSIITRIKNNEFSKLEQVYNKLEKKELEDNIDTLTAAFEAYDETKPYQGHIFNFKKIVFLENVYLSRYENEQGNKKDFIVDISRIKSQLLPAHAYTKINKQIIEDYEQNCLKLQERLKEKVVKNE